MSRAVVSVAVGNDHYLRGLMRLRTSFKQHARDVAQITFMNALPPGSPPHSAMPYCFKSFALQHAKMLGYRQLLWADSCIVTTQSLEPIWAYAAEHGAWISDNGWLTSQWCPDHAYPILFPGMSYEEARAHARTIKHPVATTFAVDLDTEKGRAVFDGYSALCQTDAIRGPWKNTPETPCGPPDCLGARHDQLIIGVVAHNVGIPLTQPPEYFAYYPGTDQSCLLADGAHAFEVA